MRSFSRIARFLLAIVALSLAACTAQETVSTSQDAAILAPTGKLRVGVYVGSPSSIIEATSIGDSKGVGFDLGKALAARLDVLFEPVIFASNAGVLAAVKSGQVDVTFTNSTTERQLDMDFSETYMDVEKSFLVPRGSSLLSFAELGRPGVRIGVSAGSSTAEELRPLYPNAILIQVSTLAHAQQMLGSGQIDAFATNDAILFQLSDGLGGSRVLAGHWGMEHFAAAIPKGRQQALPYLRRFIKEVQSEGLVSQAIKRAGLRGTVASTNSVRD